MPKKSKKRPHRSNAKQVNKAKQVQLLQKQQQQQQQESPAAGAAAKAGRNKHVRSKSAQALASSTANGGGYASGGHAPTGSGPPAHPWDPNRDLPTRGLLNLGNTCFFNSALQNVFKARLLHEALFADGSGRREGEYVGPLTKAFRKVLLEMTGEGPVGGRRGAYSPKALLSAVQRAHPSFRGYHQQDAHELFMRLVGTLEDEEDLFIKKRRQEEEKSEDEKREKEDVNGGSGVGTGREGGEAQSSADVETGSTAVSTPASQSIGEDTKPSADDRSGDADTMAANIAEEGAGGVRAEDDGALATPDAEKEGSDIVVSDNAQERPKSDSLSLQEACSVLASARGDREETSNHCDGAVAASPDAPPDPLCGRDKAELITACGEACAGNGAEKGRTAEGKSSGDAGAELTQVAGAIAGGEDEEVVLAVADHSPIERSSSDEEGVKADDLQRGGGGGVDVDADTSTDDGETTDAGDHDDDDDDDKVGGAAVMSPSQPLSELSAEPEGTHVAAVETQMEEEKGEREDIVGVAAPAVPQRAAVTEVFGGTLCSVVTCSSCGGRSFCTEPTVCLSLEIPMKPKVLSKTAQAFIAKKKAKAKAAAAAKATAAAAGVDSADAESGTTTADSACTTEHHTSPASSGDAVEGATEPALGGEDADEAEGFELSAKEKRKVARHEKQRLIKAKAKADECDGGDAAGSPGPESDYSRLTAGKSPTGGAEGAAQTPPDGDEVRQCLEHVLSACIAEAGADGGNVFVAGLDSKAVAVEKEAGASEIGIGEMAGNSPEALLPGFELSAKERKKIARQEKLGRQRSMGREASTDGGGEDVPQTSPDEGHELADMGTGRADASEQPTRATAHLEPEGVAVRSTADVETTKKPSARGEGEAKGAAVDDSVKYDSSDSGAGGGAGTVGEKDGSALNVSAVLAVPASPVAEESSASANSEIPEEQSEAQRPTRRAADTCERPGCDTRKCGDGPPASEDVGAGAGDSGRVGQAEETKATAQVASDRPQDRVEIGNNEDGVGTLSSVGSLAGCTTAETEGSTDLRGDIGSAFGSECSEGNRNEETPEDGANSTDSARKCVGSSDKPNPEADKGPGGHAPVEEPRPTGLEENEVPETKSASPERGQGPPLANGGVSVADENGQAMRTANGSVSDRHADELGGESAASQENEEAAVRAPSAASQSPLNRLEEPPARVRPDRRHDVDGIDLYGCLDHFMAEERLVAEDGNGYDCEGCTLSNRPPKNEEKGGGGAKADPAGPRRQQNAKKRLLMLGQPPGVLVCHLKRLQAKRKIIRSVEFPIELDMAPYFWRDPQAPLTPNQTCYRLTGLIQHRGSRLGGHYVAYVRDKEGWKHASDSAIRTATLPELKASEAYMLFYEQVSSANAEGDESGVSGMVSSSSDGNAVVDQTSGDQDPAESGGATLSTGNTSAAAVEAAEGGHEEKLDDDGGEGAFSRGEAEEEGGVVTYGATQDHEEKGESDTAGEKGGEGRPNEEIWI